MATAKKKRGRPKIHVTDEREVGGIKHEPSGDPNHGTGVAFELIYDSATELRKLASLMTKMKSEHLQIKITPNSIHFLSSGPKENMILLFSVDCTKVNRYYSAGDYMITLNTVNFCRIINSLSASGKKAASFERIAFIGKHDELDTKILLVTKQRGGAISSDILHLTNMGPFDDWNRVMHYISIMDDYCLRTTITMDLFKNIITKAQRLSQDIRFEKTQDEDALTYQYAFKGGWGFNISKIWGQSAGNSIIHKGEILTVSMDVAGLKALTKLALANNITLYMDNEFPIILRCELDVFDAKMILRRKGA